MPISATMHPVSSSMIAEMGYNPEAQVLYIRFKAGNSLYRYDELDPVVYAALTAAESAGKFFLKNIKGKYACVKVE
jgi:hypothetical protein